MSGTLCSSESNNSDLYKLSTYSRIHRTRGYGKSGGVLAMFVHNSLTYSVRKNLSSTSEDIEALYIEAINANSETILVNKRYRHPAVRYIEFEIYLKKYFYTHLRTKSLSWQGILI